MSKKSPTTGTGKKAQKAEYKAHKYFAEDAVRESKENRPYKTSAKKELQGISKGKHGVTSSVGELNKKLSRSREYAEQYYAPLQEKTTQQALKDFERTTQPQIVNNFGRESGAGSSALQQAMAAAKVDLHDRLATNFEGLRTNLAQNMLSQSEQGKLMNLNARLQSNQGLMGNPVSPIGGGIQNSYLQPQQGQASGVANAAGGLAQGGGTALTAWWLAKAAAAPATGGASLALPV